MSRKRSSGNGDISKAERRTSNFQLPTSNAALGSGCGWIFAGAAVVSIRKGKPVLQAHFPS
jgi:hypothetical protein